MKQLGYNEGSQNITPESNIQKINEIKEQLSGIGAVNFSFVLQGLQEVGLSDIQKSEIAPFAISKIQNTIKGGHWNDLRGANELLTFLGVESLEFSNNWTKRIADLYQRFSYNFLKNLSPSLFNGRLSDGREYDRNEYTKEKLCEMGEEELTDEFVNFLWGVREILIHMHSNRIQFNTRLTIGHLLSIDQ